MSNFKSKASELKLLIDNLTDDIESKSVNNLLDDVNALLNQRHILLAELIAIPSSDEDKKNLIDYLNAIRGRDQHILQGLKEDRDKVKNTLSKIGQLKNYLNN